MSFGKPREPQTNNFKHEFNNMPYENSNQGSFNFGSIVTGVAGIVILSSTVFITTVYFGSTQNTSASVSSYFANEPTPVARKYEKKLLKSGSIFGGASGQLKISIQRTETGFSPIDSELHERCLKPHFPSEANDVMRLGYISFSARKGIKFLSCSASIFKSRFCESKYRARFAKRLMDAIKSHHKVEALKKKLAGSKTVQGHTFRQFQAHKSLNDSSANNGINGGQNRGPIISANMSAQLAELSKHGLISKDDFSSFFKDAPPEILKHLHQQQYTVCPSSWF